MLVFIDKTGFSKRWHVYADVHCAVSSACSKDDHLEPSPPLYGVLGYFMVGAKAATRDKHLERSPLCRTHK